jgi:hypothetical protein
MNLSKKIMDGTLNDTIDKLKIASSKWVKKWHKDYKQFNPKK